MKKLNIQHWVHFQKIFSDDEVFILKLIRLDSNYFVLQYPNELIQYNKIICAIF